MYLVARVAKGFGAGSPLLLASEYGLIAKSFLDSLQPEEKIFIDHHLLNRLIEAENEAQDEAMEKGRQDCEHPGMEKYTDPDDFWAEAERANKGLD
jgi:hypothetical protein